VSSSSPGEVGLAVSPVAAVSFEYAFLAGREANKFEGPGANRCLGVITDRDNVVVVVRQRLVENRVWGVAGDFYGTRIELLHARRVDRGQGRSARQGCLRVDDALQAVHHVVSGQGLPVVKGDAGAHANHPACRIRGWR